MGVDVFSSATRSLPSLVCIIMPGAAAAGAGSSVGIEGLGGFEGDCERSILRFGRGGMMGMSLPNVLPLPPG